MSILLEQSYTAVVRSPDGIHLEVSAGSPEERTSRLIDYIASRYAFTLWPDDGERVRRLIAAGDHDAAVAAYFDLVGDRWDEERLELR